MNSNMVCHNLRQVWSFSPEIYNSVFGKSKMLNDKDVTKIYSSVFEKPTSGDDIPKIISLEGRVKTDDQWKIHQQTRCPAWTVKTQLTKTAVFKK